MLRSRMAAQNMHINTSITMRMSTGTAATVRMNTGTDIHMTAVKTG